MEDSLTRYEVLEPTEFGPVVIVWELRERRALVARVILSQPGLPSPSMLAAELPEALRASSASIDELKSTLAAILRGEPCTIPLELADLERCSGFQESVLRAEHRIPRGKVSTYQRIATHLRAPRAARAVGTALARNPFPLIVPCHRAIRSDGALGGFQGGLAMKRRLLELEGARFDSRGCLIDPSLFY